MKKIIILEKDIHMYQLDIRLKCTLVSREFKHRRRRRLGKRRLKTELAFLLQISRMAGCIQPALLRQNYLKLNMWRQASFSNET